MRKLWLNILLFYEAARLSYVALFRWLNPPTYLASKILMPAASLLFFTFIGTYASGPGAASFFVIGNAIQMAAVNGIYGTTMSIGGDRHDGTLPYIFGVPGNRLMLFLGRALFQVLDGALGVVFGLLFGVLVMGLDMSHTNFALLALVIAVATISTVGLGLLLGAISLVTVNVMFVNNLFYFLLLLFSGANVRLELLPGWMQAVSSVLPLTRSVAAARLVIAGAGFSQIGPMLGQEIALGAVYALAGYIVFRVFEDTSRRLGTLEAF